MTFYKGRTKNDLLFGCEFRMFIEIYDFQLK